MRVVKCKGCGKEVIWVRMDTGKRIPCDVDMTLYWKMRKGKSCIVTPNGEIIACTFDGDLNKATGVGFIPH